MSAVEPKLRPRAQQQTQLPPTPVPAPNLAAGAIPKDAVSPAAHPSGKETYGKLRQVFRIVTLALYFGTSVISIWVTQIIGAGLYWVNRDLFYSYMALTKQSFGLLITTMTHWWGSTTIRISGDESVAEQIRKTPGGLVEFDFPERIVMIANHQIYTDWLYLWWVSYANRPHLHGHIYIILKESLKRLPVLGTGMMLFGFIFMSRKMAVDQERMAYRLRKLRQLHTTPAGKKYLDPMWLLLFPEGTNSSVTGRAKSAHWADKIGVKNPDHLLLPRSTGMYFCLNELKGTVDYIYDCTVAYEGIPRGCYGENYFTISSTYFRGQPPKSVNFYWRRFRVADIPLETQESFDLWLRERWYEKDALMEQYLSTGRFPPSPRHAVSQGIEGHLETEVRTRHWWEFVEIFVVLGVFGLVTQCCLRIWAQLTRIMS